MPVTRSAMKIKTPIVAPAAMRGLSESSLLPGSAVTEADTEDVLVRKDETLAGRTVVEEDGDEIDVDGSG